MVAISSPPSETRLDTEIWNILKRSNLRISNLNIMIKGQRKSFLKCIRDFGEIVILQILTNSDYAEEK